MGYLWRSVFFWTTHFDFWLSSSGSTNAHLPFGLWSALVMLFYIFCYFKLITPVDKRLAFRKAINRFVKYTNVPPTWYVINHFIDVIIKYDCMAPQFCLALLYYIQPSDAIPSSPCHIIGVGFFVRVDTDLPLLSQIKRWHRDSDMLLWPWEPLLSPYFIIC